MTINYRDGAPADLPTIDALFWESFRDTFAQPLLEDLAALSSHNFTPEALGQKDG